MAVKPFVLTKNLSGINLMRSKGGATQDSLFDLKNGWLTAKRTVKARPGTVKPLTFPAGTKGVIGFEGEFHTFSHTAVAGTLPSNLNVHILKHPTGGAAALTKVHRKFPYLGRLYVVGEFADGVVQHYWIENPAARANSTVYSYGAVVQPATANGYYYEIATKDATAAWQANTEVTVGTKKQPRVANGFRYTVTATTGTAPIRTGNTEPTWPTVEGATVVERRFVTEEQQPPGGTETSGGDGAPRGGGGGAGSEYGPFPPSGDGSDNGTNEQMF